MGLRRDPFEHHCLMPLGFASVFSAHSAATNLKIEQGCRRKSHRLAFQPRYQTVSENFTVSTAHPSSKQSLCYLCKEEIGFPLLFDITNVVTQEHHMAWPEGAAFQRHARLLGCAVAFAIIAWDASRHKVFPCIPATTRLWMYVIHRQAFLTATILAAHPIPPKNIAPRE